MNHSGIYAIINMLNDKLYVGSAVHLGNRWKNHKVELRLNRHQNDHLQSAWNIYGEINFKFYVLEFVADRNNLIAREQHWIDHSKCANPEIGYNISPTAGSCAGVKHSDETKAKLSVMRKGRPCSEERRAAIKESWKNRKPVTEEAKRNMSLAHKGKKQPDSFKAKMSERLKGNTINNGRKQSAEQIENRVKQFRGIKHEKPRNRNITEWPCPDGRACKCNICMEKKREWKRKWRAAKAGVDKT